MKKLVIMMVILLSVCFVSDVIPAEDPIGNMIDINYINKFKVYK